MILFGRTFAAQESMRPNATTGNLELGVLTRYLPADRRESPSSSSSREGVIPARAFLPPRSRATLEREEEKEGQNPKEEKNLPAGDTDKNSSADGRKTAGDTTEYLRARKVLEEGSFSAGDTEHLS